MNEEIISVLIVNYNHQDTIRETVQSVLDQSYKNIQLIIVDDGSTDKSCQVIEKFEDDRIELYRLEKNCHICAATNFGFTKVKGKYLARIDSDDIWYPEKLSKQIEFMKNTPNCHVCFSYCDLIDDFGNNINIKEKELSNLYSTAINNRYECMARFYHEGNFLSHSSLLMETNIMREIGDFKLGYRQLHDFDYWIRIIKHHSIFVVPEYLAAVRRFQTNMSVNVSSGEEKNNVRMINEFFDIRAHFFDDISDDDFIKAFRKDFVRADASSKAEIECEKAFLVCKAYGGGVAPEGIKKLQELFEKPEIKNVLESKYNFNIKEFYELNSEHLYFDVYVQRYVHKLNDKIKMLVHENSILINDIDELKKENDILKNQVIQYSSSLSWKITEPLREIANKIRKIIKIK